MLRGPSLTTTTGRFFAENQLTIRSANTRRKMTSVLRRLEVRYPTKRVNEITHEDLRDFLLFDDKGKPREVCGGTVLSNRTYLRSFFSWCAYAGLTKVDPSAGLVRSVRATAAPTRQHLWLDADEVSTVFEACYSDPEQLRGHRDAVAIGLGVFCGLRLHEIAGVTWGDVNLRSGHLAGVGKGTKSFQLPIAPQLVEILTDWKSLIEKELERPVARDESVLARFQKVGGFDGNGRILEVIKGGLGRDGVSDVVRRRGAEAGLPELRPHDLRRTFAGILEDNDVELREISKLLRHSSIATTERYLESNPKRWKDSVANAMMGVSTRRKA